jgi:hypothetical protein
LRIKLKSEMVTRYRVRIAVWHESRWEWTVAVDCRMWSDALEDFTVFIHSWRKQSMPNIPPVHSEIDLITIPLNLYLRNVEFAGALATFRLSSGMSTTTNQKMWPLLWIIQESVTETLRACHLPFKVIQLSKLGEQYKSTYFKNQVNVWMTRWLESERKTSDSVDDE